MLLKLKISSAAAFVLQSSPETHESFNRIARLPKFKVTNVAGLPFCKQYSTHYRNASLVPVLCNEYLSRDKVLIDHLD